MSNKTSALWRGEGSVIYRPILWRGSRRWLWWYSRRGTILFFHG